jgi:hypothetical protein
MAIKLRPVFGLDIDGTLLAYHQHFVHFANQYFDIFADPNGYDAREPFHKYLGVSKIRYRQCKLAYRRGQLKRSLPPLDEPYPDARLLTRELRELGAQIWLCTTRPYLSHDEVDDATRHNLRRNGVVYNGILWGEKKYHELVRTVGRERIAGVLDDVPEMCTQAVKLGLPTAFAVRPHNAEQWLHLGAENMKWAPTRTHDDTLTWAVRALTDWRGLQA